MKSMIIPPFLKAGDNVAVISPSGIVNEAALLAGTEVIRSWGLNPVIGGNALMRDGIFAGSDEQRLADLQWALDDNEIKALFCSRGGHGLTRIVDKLDKRKLLKSPKWLVGFSDITVLHNWFAVETGIATIHGEMPANYGKEVIDKESVESVRRALFGGDMSNTWKGRFLREEKVEGIITGGNLTLINALAGTKWDIDTTDKILFIEETGEYLYRFDRMMQHLRLTGKLNNLKALLVGGLDQISEGTTLWGMEPWQVVEETIGRIGVPLFFDYPAGHRPVNRAIYMGVKCTITPEKGAAAIKYELPGF